VSHMNGVSGVAMPDHTFLLPFSFALKPQPSSTIIINININATTPDGHLQCRYRWHRQSLYSVPMDTGPLTRKTRWIRILILLPPASPDTAELHCEIATAKISNNPSYEAISYCWGAKVFPETLYLPSGTLATTKNLAGGLRRFRLTDRPRRLWADAVYINQYDDKEKDDQVALMAKIYRNAECVLVWLGEGSPAVHTGIECIRRLASLAPNYGLKYENLVKQITVIRRDLFNRKNAISAALIQLSIELNFYSIGAFFDQDWFKRLWIVQGFVLASRIEIHNGYDLLSPEEISLSLAILGLLQLHSHIPPLNQGYLLSDCYALVLLRLVYSGKNPRANLLSVVSFTSWEAVQT
jgi:hypothetical protein